MLLPQLGVRIPKSIVNRASGDINDTLFQSDSALRLGQAVNGWNDLGPLGDRATGLKEWGGGMVNMLP